MKKSLLIVSTLILAACALGFLTIVGWQSGPIEVPQQVFVQNADGTQGFQPFKADMRIHRDLLFRYMPIHSGPFEGDPEVCRIMPFERYWLISTNTIYGITYWSVKSGSCSGTYVPPF